MYKLYIHWDSFHNIFKGILVKYNTPEINGKKVYYSAAYLFKGIYICATSSRVITIWQCITVRIFIWGFYSASKLLVCRMKILVKVKFLQMGNKFDNKLCKKRFGFLSNLKIKRKNMIKIWFYHTVTKFLL